MHKALAIPEILSLIFERVAKGDQARCARICKQWFAEAIRVLWLNYTPIQQRPLLDILGVRSLDRKRWVSGQCCTC